MKSIWINALACALILCTIDAHAQKKKAITRTTAQPPTKVETESPRVFTMEERQTLYMPINDPKPCSVFLLDFGTTKDKVLAEAARIGLVTGDTTKFGSHSFYEFSEPEYAMYYRFGFDHNDRYYSFEYVSNKTEVAYAVQQHEAYLRQLWLYWDAKQDESYTAEECPHTKESRFISVNRDEKEVRFRVDLRD